MTLISETKLAGPRRAASVIVATGAGSAPKVYRYLKEDEVEQFIPEIARFDQLAVQDMEDMLDNFCQVCLTQGVIIEGGVGYVRNILERTYGPQMASSLSERVTRNLRIRVFRFIRKADYKNIIAIIQSEHPQTTALILSYTSASQTASVIGELPEGVRLEVVERIATMDRTSPEIVRIVEQNLEKRFSPLMPLDLTETGGVNYTADIMSNMGRVDEKYIFDESTHKDAVLCEEVRKRMFVFKDITALDDTSVQRLLRGMNSKDPMFVLKGASKEVAETISKNMSTRSSESVCSDLRYTHNARLRSVEEAQQRVAGIIRRLESKGELVIMKGRKDELIV